MQEIRSEFGEKKACSIGANEFIYTVTNDPIKFIGLEIVGQTQVCTVNVDLLLPDDSLYTRFGEDVGVAKDKHTRLTEGGDPIVPGMKIKVTLDSSVAEDIAVTFIVNKLISTGLSHSMPTAVQP